MGGIIISPILDPFRTWSHENTAKGVVLDGGLAIFLVRLSQHNLNQSERSIWTEPTNEIAPLCLASPIPVQ